MSERIIHDGYYQFVIIETDHGPRELVRTSNSVSLLIHDIVKRKIILVKQKREAMIRPDNPDGLIIESVAGRFDADFGVKELMVKEAKQEAGVTISESDIELLNNGQPMALSAGVITELCYLGYVEVTPQQIEEKDRLFGTDPGEIIKRIFVSIENLEDFICGDMRVFALIQYLLKKLEKEKIRRER